MLTLVPGTPGTAAVPARPAYRECHTEQPGRYETRAETWRTLIPAGTGLATAVQTGLIPAGATILNVYNDRDPNDPYTVFRDWLIVYYSVALAVWVPVGQPATVCVDHPEQPAVSGMPAEPARWDVQAIRAWDSGANSISELDGDVRLSFTQQRVVGAVVGLVSDRIPVTSVDRYQHAFYFFQTAGGQPRYQVREGNRRVGPVREYVAGDQFEIQRAAERARYLHNGLHVHESAAIGGGVSVGCALFATGDGVG